MDEENQSTESTDDQNDGVALDSDQHDPSDPQVAVKELREQLTTTESRYQQQLNAARAAQERERIASEKLQAVYQDKAALEFSTVNNALEAAQMRGEQLQNEHTRALEVGDYAKASQLQTEMMRVATRIETLENGKLQLEQNRNQQLLQPAQQTQQRQMSEAERIEADLSRFDARAVAWIKKHTDASGMPKYYTDPQFQARVIGAANLALGNNIPENSPEYFDFVERTAGVTTQNNNQSSGRSVPTAAPARSSGNINQNRSSNSNFIPAEATRVAKTMGVDPVAYWAEVQRMDRANEFKQGNPYKQRG